jgi:hypothetical protein
MEASLQLCASRVTSGGRKFVGDWVVGCWECKVLVDLAVKRKNVCPVRIGTDSAVIQPVGFSLCSLNCCQLISDKKTNNCMLMFCDVADASGILYMLLRTLRRPDKTQIELKFKEETSKVLH